MLTNNNHLISSTSLSLVIAILLLSMNATAATIDVNAQIGEPGCDLAEAIDSANTNTAVGGCISGANNTTDIIRLNFSSSISTFVLDEVNNSSSAGANGLPVIYSDMKIVGYGNSPVKIVRKVGFGVPNFRIFRVFGTESVVTLENLAIEGGRPDDRGGAIYYGSTGSLNIINCRFRDNTGTVGGAIYSVGDELYVDKSHFSGNIAAGIVGSNIGSNGAGGAIFNSRKATIANSTFTGNSGADGGAIYSYGFSGAETNIYSSEISFNTSAESGGGISVSTSTTLSIFDSTIYQNISDKGGGLYIGGYEVISLLINTSIANNLAERDGGGVLYLALDTDSIFFTINSIISNNTADILNNGGRRGDEIHASVNPSTLSLAHSIIGHSGLSTSDAIVGEITIGANNIFTTSDGDTPTPIDQIIGPLQSNGGLTKTTELPPGSPAINKAIDGIAVNSLISFYIPGCRGTEIGPVTPIPAFRADQRGIKRPSNGACDIGAFEVEEEDSCYIIKAENSNAVVFCL